MRELIFTSSILILAVALLRRTVGRYIPARARYALWLVVLLRLAIPFSPIESSVSAAGLLSFTGTAPAAPAVPQAPAPFGGATDTGTGSAAAVPDTPAAPSPPGAPRLPAGTLYLIWAAGSLAAGGWMLAENLRFARRLRAGRVRLEPAQAPGPGGPPEAMPCPLPVWRCEGLISPCLFGALRPAIYLNGPACQSLAARRWAVRHEWQHYRHGDHLWCLARCACLAVYWWHPLVWLAASLSRRDCELACDEGVTAALGQAERLDYGRWLLALAPPQRAKLYRAHPLAATGMSESARQLGARLTAIAAAHKPAVWAAAVAGLAAVGLAATTLTRAPSLPRDPAAALDQLQNSIAVRDGTLGFTLPETGFGPGEWSIHISGSARMGEERMSLHLLEEQQSWQGGVWYPVASEDELYGSIAELWLDAALPDGDSQRSITVDLLDAALDAASQRARALSAALPEGEEVWVDYRLDAAYTLVYSYFTADGPPNDEDAVHGHVYLVPVEAGGVLRVDPLTEEKGQLLDELAEGEGYFFWPPVWLNEGQRVLFGWQTTTGAALTTRLWTIENGAPKELDCPAEQLIWQDGNEFTGTRSAWDATQDEDGATGHTQKIYWLFWDEEAGALREYAGEEITERELLDIAQKGGSGQNAQLVRQVLDAIRAEGSVLGRIWLRGNGIVNINYRIPLNEAGTAWANHNASLASDANRNLSLIGFHHASSGGLQSELLLSTDQGGVYEAAGWPEIAVEGRTVLGHAPAGGDAG